MGWVEGAPPATPKTGGGCCRGMARVWLIVFNIFFMLLGMGIIAIGVLLRYNTALFETYALDILTAAEVEGTDLKTVLQSVAIVFILLGVIVTVFAVMGIVGACCSVKMLLTIYALIMLKIIIIEIVLIVLLLAFRSEIDSRIKSALQVTLDTFQGYNSTEPVTMGWNYIFSKFDCCGIDDYRDLDTATNWPTLVTYQGVVVNFTAPLFCCKLNATYPTTDLPSTPTCASAPTDQTSNYLQGCYDAVEEYIMKYRTALMVIAGLILLCEIVNIITAIMVRQGLVADENRKRQHRRKHRAWQRKNNKVSF